MHECITAGREGNVFGDVGPAACGSVLADTGYACSTKNLVSSWRKQWSVTPGSTDPTFPFGIVSLAAGTSEGNPQNMANFRYKDVDIILHRISRISQPCTSPHAPCGVLLLVVMRVEC